MLVLLSPSEKQKILQTVSRFTGIKKIKCASFFFSFFFLPFECFYLQLLCFLWLPSLSTLLWSVAPVISALTCDDDYRFIGYKGVGVTVQKLLFASVFSTDNHNDDGDDDDDFILFYFFTLKNLPMHDLSHDVPNEENCVGLAIETAGFEGGVKSGCQPERVPDFLLGMRGRPLGAGGPLLLLDAPLPAFFGRLIAACRVRASTSRSPRCGSVHCQHLRNPSTLHDQQQRVS